MLRAFVDTSAWFAYVNRADREHAAVCRVVNGFRSEGKGRLVTSNLVFAETVSLCRYRLGHDAASRVGEALLDEDTVDSLRVTPADERAAWRLFRERGNQRYSFTDCTSFVLMRRLEITLAISLSDGFSNEGFTVSPGEAQRLKSTGWVGNLDDMPEDRVVASRVARLSRRDLLASIKRLTPEQRLNAFLNQNQLLTALRQAGGRPSSRQRTGPA